LVLLSVWVVACAPGDDGPDRFEQLFAGTLRVVDLTHPLSADMPWWPNPDGNPFHYEIVAAHPDGSSAMGAYSTPEHHGTHLDAPVHTAAGQPSVDELTAEDLLGPAVVIDISDRAAENPDYRLTEADVRAFERDHGRIPDRAVVLLATGWSRKWTTPEAYRNLDAEGRLHFPGFGVDAARFLVEERDIRGIGIDDMSVDYGLSTDFPVHRMVNGAGRYHLENVANLYELPPTGVYLIVAPISIAGGSGGQVRIFAVVPGSGSPTRR